MSETCAVSRSQRAEVMDQILTYNKEDLEATWAVFEWLRKVRLN